jgi:hypothetical protein
VDFSAVRVHTGDRADESARSIGARAYTVGRDTVFAAGQLQPMTGDGRRLIAHELTHVLQQQFGNGVKDFLTVSSPADPAEVEAAGMSEQVLEGNSTQNVEVSAKPLAVARQVPAPAVRPSAPTRPPLRSLPGGRTGPGGRPLRTEDRPRHAPALSEMTLEELMESAAQKSQRDQAIAEAETPTATLARGGKPPDFITDEGEGQAIGTYGTISYRKRALHILDAIEYEVERANDEADLAKIREKYIPEVTPPPDRLQPILVPMIPYRTFRIPNGLDSGASARMGTYVRAVKRRAAQRPSLQKAVTLDPETERRRQRPGAYPICWPLQLHFPAFFGVAVRFFTRTPKPERDTEFAEQQRLELRYREAVDPDFRAKGYHVHHSVPLFLGGLDGSPGNLVTLPAMQHLYGHQVLRHQPQMLTPTPPLSPLDTDMYSPSHKAGTEYELVGFKRVPTSTVRFKPIRQLTARLCYGR